MAYNGVLTETGQSLNAQGGRFQISEHISGRNSFKLTNRKKGMTVGGCLKVWIFSPIFIKIMIISSTL
jgi:hypothetical protein